MNLIRHSEFFDPFAIKEPVHVIGVGAIGSHVAEQLVRMGITHIAIWDFDKVEDKNIPNQLYTFRDVGMDKVDALKRHLLDINPDLNLRTRGRWYPTDTLNGYVFMCVDTIDVRKQIVEACEYNTHCLGLFDFRMRLTDAQHYAADPSDSVMLKNFKGSMDFSQEEAKEATPVSACGSSLSVLPTIRVISAVGVANFMNFVKTGELKPAILIDAFSFEILAFRR